MTIFISHVSPAASVPLYLDIFFIFFSPFRSKSKDFLCLKVRTNFHVDSWPLTLLLKKSRVSPICLMQTLYCWGGGFSFWQSVHWTCEERWEKPTNVKNMPYSAWRLWGGGGVGGGTQEMSNNTQLTFTFFGGGKIVMLLQMSNSSEDLLQGCRFPQQRTFAVCTRLSPWCAPLSRDWTVSASRLKSG